jgi:hypothetical protein
MLAMLRGWHTGYTDVFHGFPQILQADARFAPQAMINFFQILVKMIG